MASIRAAARAALARKVAHDVEDEGRATRTNGEDVKATGARASGTKGDARGRETKKAKTSRWGSDDDDDEDLGVGEDERKDANGRTGEDRGAERGYVEKMLAEAYSFAAAQMDATEAHPTTIKRKMNEVGGQKLFITPSPSASEGGDGGNGPTQKSRRDVSSTLKRDLTELDADDDVENELMVGPARPSAAELYHGHTDDDIVGPSQRLAMTAEDEPRDDAEGPQLESKAEEEHARVGVSMPPLSKRPLNMLQGCRSVDEFERLNKIDEGTYGIVFKARDKTTGEVAALKRVKMEKEVDGFPLTALREINILLSLDHPSIVNVNEVVVGSSVTSVFMVMEYVENDLKGIMDQMARSSVPRFTIPEVKSLMMQLFSGIAYLHENWILHRDLKMTNILVTNKGELKICDFGLARQYGDPVGTYTQLVVTLWYRAPELLLGAKKYGPAIDVWSLGCIFGELLAGAPLFNGRAEIDQLHKIFKLLGTPNDKIWPEFSSLPSVEKVTFAEQPYNKLRQKFPRDTTGLTDDGFELLNRLLTYDPSKRFTCAAALNHPFFCEFPAPQNPRFVDEI